MFAQTSLGRFAPLALVFSLACSARVDLDDGNGGNGGGGEGGSGGNVNPECVPFHDAEPASAITIRFINQTGQDVFLPATCDSLDYSVTPSAGEDGVDYGPTGGACQQTCDALQSEDPLLCAADACAPSSIRLSTGQVREVVWDGRGQVGAEMPLVCWHSKDAGTTCTQIVNAPAGSYDVFAQGFAECGEACECDESGVCFGEASGWEAYANPASINVPSEGVVEVVFDVCAFGCAG
jgi:hypothetical protein